MWQRSDREQCQDSKGSPLVWSANASQPLDTAIVQLRNTVQRPAIRTTQRHTIHVTLKPQNPLLPSPLIAERKTWSSPPRPHPFSSPPAPAPRPSSSQDLVSAR
ncbi:hypothetical protein DM02DRAFT_621113 [Periconia macrospinosa]|uniref:Uncharacterized protein n=1 Tax=Periconia macrospinosa TaxID=97972 RepID=A0A2V1CWY3_9PLEO|nr:hypothetical protein DM02DRAFT_621113 [Periconia macrospinosa]